MKKQENCPYFKKCGGCLFQDMPVNEYIEFKKKEALLILDPLGIKVKDLIYIGPHNRRRATFTYNPSGFGFNGFHSHQIININSCMLLTPEFEKIIPDLKKVAVLVSGSGDLAVRMCDDGADIHIIPKNRKNLNVSVLEDFGEVCRDSFVARLVYDNDLIYQKCPLSFPNDVFCQPSVAGEEFLINWVKNNINPNYRAADLFCGNGTFTIPLKKMGIDICGYDIIKSANYSGIEFYERDLFKDPLGSQELAHFQSLVVDPPRKGALNQIRQIAQSDVKQVLMISCNPKTFAVDAKCLLESGFKTDGAILLDQFVFSRHIELVCKFERLCL